MNVSEETVKKIAHLSRLSFDKEGSKEIAEDMTRILTWVDKLNEIDTEGVSPITNMSVEVNAFREDVVKDQLDHDKALKNAPNKDSNYLRVPKVLD